MSKESKVVREEKIDIGTLATQIQLLREQIDVLQAYLQQLVQARDSVVKAMDSIKAVNTTKGSILVYLDPHMNVAITANPVEKDKMLVHIGLNVYAKVGLEEALRILEDRRARLDKAVNDTRRAIGNLASLHDQYQALLQKALAQARERG